ncbi:MAG: hypothetical protein M1305_05515 [Candidatus Marsarchaeota archaeon]|nr:hypothetical protein [Candidatus Marsarchaeota archaeon]
MVIKDLKGFALALGGMLPTRRARGRNSLDIRELRDRTSAFDEMLAEKKAEVAPRDFPWYPYGTLSNFIHLDALLTGQNRFLLDLIGGMPVADVGGADGDLAFFLESLGVSADIVDHAPTNYNGLRGARLLKTGLSSSVEIHDVDLDSQFTLPPKTYGLVFFLGILYHLKNPYYALEYLAKRARYCLISTRVARFAPDRRTKLSDVPVAYLLDEQESNNDSTNYWIFSDAGFRRILKRTWWEICDYMTVGNTINSDPATKEGDEKAFCLVRSHVFEAQLVKL